MQKIFDYALNIFLFLSPIFLFKDYQASFSRSLFFIVGTIIIFSISLGMKQKREFKNIIIPIVLLYFLFRAFFMEEIGSGNWYNFWLSMSGFIYILCGVLLFRTVYCYADNIKFYFKPIFLVCLVNLILCLFQYFNYDFVWNGCNYINNIFGFFELPQQLGQYSAISIPILFSINPFLSVIPFVLLFMSKEITPMVATLIGIMFFSFYINKKVIAIILLCLFIILSFYQVDYIKHKWKTRPDVWKKVLSESMKKPYIGYGYDSFRNLINKNKGKIGFVHNSTAFSDYFHSMFEFGIPILILFFLFFKNLFIKFHKMYGKSLSLICLGTSICIGLINMSGQIMVRHASIAGTFIVLLALFCIQMEKEYGSHIS